jgi:hypothetical protein
VSFITRAKKKIKTIYFHLREWIVLPFTKTLYVSIGENCLSDDILRRHKLKSFTTLFSHGRSNVDYINQLESSGYDRLLDKSCLQAVDLELESVRVVRSLIYKDCDPIFHRSVSEGFEFTHHDVIHNESHRKSALRKIKRLRKLRGKKNFVMLYHHRTSPTSDLRKLKDKIKLLQAFFAGGRYRAVVVVFTQALVESMEERGVDLVSSSDDVFFFVFRTISEWAGDNQEVFWARQDDDLITEMWDVFHRECSLVKAV